MSDAATWAARLATAINRGTVGKGSGPAVTIETTLPAGLLLADLESRIDAAGRDLARNQAALESMGPDFPRPRAGLADTPLDAAEAERIGRVIETFEEEVFG